MRNGTRRRVIRPVRGPLPSPHAMYKHDDSPGPVRLAPDARAESSQRPVAGNHRVPLAVVIVAIFGMAVTSGCAVAPAPSPAVVSCVVAAPPAPPSAPPPATTPTVLRVVARPAYVRPVVPPLPMEVYQPSTPGAGLPKAAFYGSEMVAAMVQTVPATDVFVAGGDTYFWHKDPHGRRERVFYGHGDRRAEATQRRADAPSPAAESDKIKGDTKL
jgi:hypothetical protein